MNVFFFLFLFQFQPQTEHFFVVMCEILKATGVNTQCKDLATISKEIKTTSKELSAKTVKCKSNFSI